MPATPPPPGSAELAERLARLFPALDAPDQRLSLAIYRELARGAPVRLPALSLRLGMEPEDATRRAQGWPGVYYDDERRIIGYWGLTLARVQHRLRIDGREELFAWCAWDTLFLPELLGERGHYVHFFSSRDSAAPWLEKHPDAFLLPLSDAFEVGRLRNRRRYGAALDTAGAHT